MKSLLCFLAFLIFFAAKSSALLPSSGNIVKSDIFQHYELLLGNRLTSDLLANHKLYKQSPNRYWHFLNEIFLNNWDFHATTKALIGNKIYNSLSVSQFKKLSKTLELTLIRYAFESLSFYSEQKLELIDVRLNEQKTLAWLKINIESPSFPDIHLDLLLKRRDDDQWRGVDFRFKGITYVNMKKNSYRQDFEHLKFQGLLRKLDDKNKTFFRDLCERNVNYINPETPPCL